MDRYLSHSKGRSRQPYQRANYYWFMAGLILVPALAYVAYELVVAP